MPRLNTDHSTSGGGMGAARRRPWGIQRLIVLIFAVMVFWAIAVLGLQRRVLYPRHHLVPAGEDLPPNMVIQRLSATTPTGHGEAWYLPPMGSGGKTPTPAVLFAHGNGELIDHWPDALAPYRLMGMAVFLIEYRGYGRTEGAPSQRAITEDFVAFRDMLAAREDIDETQIIYHGRSLGGGVACALAAVRPPRALILESTFTSVAAIASRAAVPRFMILDRFDNLSFVKASSLPLLILHGRRDRLVPSSHAEQLHAASHNSYLHLFAEAGHNDGLFQRAEYWNRIKDFLDEIGVLEGKIPSEDTSLRP